MLTPDGAAAALPEPMWDNSPLPEIGRQVGIKYAVTTHGRTSWSKALGTVTAVQQPDDTSLIIQLDDDKSYLIKSDSMLDTWWYVGTAAPVDGYIAADAKTAETLRGVFGLGGMDGTPFGPDVSDEPMETIGDDIPQPHPQTLAARMRRLAWLDDQIKSCEAEAAGYKTEYDALCSSTVEHMAEEGVPSITVDGNTWFMKSTPYVEKIDGATTDDIKDALKASGLASMLTTTYNANTLRSLLVEFRDSEGEVSLPEALAAVVKLSERTTIGRTRAAARKRAARQ